MSTPCRIGLLIAGLVGIGCEPNVSHPAMKISTLVDDKKPESPRGGKELPHTLNLSAIEKLGKLKIKSIRLRDEMRRPLPVKDAPFEAKDAPPKDAPAPSKDGFRLRGHSVTYVVLLEFTQDLSEEEADALRAQLQGREAPFEIYFFDADNVVLRRDSRFELMGEITGVMGDAFRLFIPVPEDKEIVKIEARGRKVGVKDRHEEKKVE
jgi:hypothetical protein